MENTTNDIQAEQIGGEDAGPDGRAIVSDGQQPLASAGSQEVSESEAAAPINASPPDQAGAAPEGAPVSETPSAAAAVIQSVVTTSAATTPVPAFMAVEALVMGTCGICAGEALHKPELGGIVCALPKGETVDCILPRLLRDLQTPLKAGDTAGSDRRTMLLRMATRSWCLQNAKNTGPLPE